MIVTFVIEIGLVIYTLVRHKMSTVVRLVSIMLVLLALFQIAEYNVCGRSTGSALVWSRIGYAAITLLPPLALHFVYVIAKKKTNVLVWLAYISSLAFVITFVFSSTAFVGHVCGGNYATFQLESPVGGLYFSYYYFWLSVSIGLSLYHSISSTKRIRQALIWQVVGYLSFLVPTGIVNAVNPATIDGIPSVMCGFAVIYAVILVAGIVPTTE